MTMVESSNRHVEVRRILLEDWDPHDALRRPEAHGTYDGYVEPLLALLTAGASEEAVMDWLAERERETMCFPSLGRERLRRVAQRLIKASSPAAG
jgi:hypothetical protein